MLLLIVGRSLREEIDLDKLVDLFAAALLAGALLAAIVLGLQLATPLAGSAWLSPLARGSGNLGQANHLADYLWLGMASAIYLRVQRRIARPAFMFSAGVLLSAASLTGSRSVIVYALGFALLSLWSARHFRQDALSRVARIALWLLPATLVLQWAFAHFDLSSALQAPVSAERLVREVSGVSARQQLWRTGLAIFAEHPWLGAGVGQFSVLAYRLVGDGTGGAYRCGEHAHNLFIQLLAEFGPLAPLLVVLLALRWWLAFIRAPWSAAHWWIAAILLVLAAHSQLEYPLWYAFFLGIAALALGIGSDAGFRLHLSTLGRLLLMLVLLLGGWTLFSLAGDYRQFERALNGTLAGASEPDSVKTRSDALARLRRESLFAHYVESIYAFQLRVDKQALPDKIAVATMAMRFSPVDRIAFNLAYLLALDNRPDAAKIALQRALANSPGYTPSAVGELEALAASFPECKVLLDELRSFPAAH